MTYREPGPATRRRGPGGGGVGHRVPARRRDPPLGPARSRSPSASTSACPAPTAGATSSGGWSAPACSTSATTRSTTSPEPATCRRRSSSARPTPHARPQRAQRSSGVRLVGRLGRIADGVAQFSGSLANMCALADLKMNRLLDRFDEWAATSGVDAELEPPQRFEPTQVEQTPLLELDLTRGGSARSSGPPATGPTTRGSTSRSSTARADPPRRRRRPDAPGLYLLGMPFLRRRRRRSSTAPRRHRSARSPPPLAPGQPYRPATTPCP